ncbi:DUF4145 domain-containing protein [Burkholderia plantarii]|uniref:DUF4145 domain-containing protein n=1 Tax=Burkholderia plantarii TaxID=41899 RepID=A0A0B6S4Z3_BURPL|nr:DUF4145 domain-containing protein [Burkholderia plantarii]AJK47301.1 hypothetical protein BGL_1c28230 [Burkholderia plantarii]
MKCPHCSIEVHPAIDENRIAFSGSYWRSLGSRHWTVAYMECPNPKCKEAIQWLHAEGEHGRAPIEPFMAYPRSTGRLPAAAEVPDDIAVDYHEACAVLTDSAKASAALSRRCLQAVLRGNGYAQKDLAPAIDAVLASKSLPSAIAENLDAVRNIGNFAAHPMKDTNTGQILPVEPHEAEWNLDVLEELFDFFYVQPEKAKQRRAALDAKLAAAGKPPMK